MYELTLHISLSHFKNIVHKNDFTRTLLSVCDLKAKKIEEFDLTQVSHETYN